MPLSFRPQAVVCALGFALLLAILTATRGAVTSKNSSIQPNSTYVEAMVGAPRFINPLLASSDTDTDLSHLIFSGLMRVDAAGNLAPDLASDYEISPDASVYTFTLRPNLRWHDGEPLTSDDVLFTIDTLVDKAFPGDPTLAMPWRGVKVELPGRRVVRLTLPAPNAAFLQYTTLGILPSHLWGKIKVADMPGADLNQAPIGSGPWRLVSGSVTPVVAGAGNLSATPVAPLSSQDGVFLEPNPYTAFPGSGISRLWFRLYPSFGAALTALQVGEVHGLGHIPAEQVSTVKALQGVQLHSQPLARYTMLLFNVRSPFFDKPETRQAFELAIDKEALVRQSLGGQAAVADSPVLSKSWAYDQSLKYPGYDPAEARRLLDSAGWRAGPAGIRARNGVTMTVVLAANSDVASNVAVSQQIAGYLRNIGVDVKLALVSRETLLRDYLGPRAFHMVLAGWQAQGADPDLYAYWDSSQATIAGGLNFSGWSNPTADKALQAVLSSPDKEQRKSYYAEFQKAFAQDVPAVILNSPLYYYATAPSARNVSLPTANLLSPAQRFDTIFTSSGNDASPAEDTSVGPGWYIKVP
ncbi:MAG: peptide ABC transporter substrate-binding protein [Chloroflexi bacterium]|nr:peptide ABC transporter substrate-binding protein [Chloroflexota bacterium]